MAKKEPKEPDGKMLTVRQVAEKLNVSSRTIHRYLQFNQISAILLPGGWRFQSEEVDRFIESKRPEKGKGTKVKRKYTKRSTND